MIITIIIPTYNEKNNIGKLLDALFIIEFKKIKSASMHVIVVDDYSPDGTSEIVQKKMKHFANLHLLSKKKEGLGHAAIMGLKHAIHVLDADAVIEMDADLQHDPGSIYKLVSAFIDGADYVVGSRYAYGGSIDPDWGWFRKTISRYGNFLVKSATGISTIKDFTSGFKLTRVKGLLDTINLDSFKKLNQFAYKLDLLYRIEKKSNKVIEIPINFNQRKDDLSKFNTKEIFASLYVTCHLAIQNWRANLREFKRSKTE
ncbi:MAG: glycosyltransferase [Desulfobacteraceae bacterium]|nr:glycosyltransferase [Desulfobacteraceae bacterium]